MTDQRKLAYLLGAAALALVSAPALAQDDAADDVEIGEESSLDDMLEERMVVTARRREESLIDVPASVTSLTSQFLENQGTVRNARELLANIPGVHFQDSTAPVQGEISIRGSATSQGTNADATVGVYRDGVFLLGGRFGGRRFGRIDLFDIQRVEVLRGAQAALYGRNAVGGAINIITAKPKLETYEVTAAGEYSTNDHVEAQGIVNIPIGSTFAARFGVDYSDQDEGFFFNPILDDFYDNENFIGFKGAVRYANGPLDVTLSADYSENDGRTLALQIVLPVSDTNPAGISQGRFTYPHNSPDFFIEDMTNIILNASYDFGWGELYSTTGYRKRVTDTSLDIDFIDPSFVQAINDSGGVSNARSDLQSLSQTTSERVFQNIYATGEALDDRLTWLVGGDWTELTDDFARQQRVLLIPTAGFLEFQDLSFTSWAAYGSLGYDITDRLNVSGEVRFTRDVKEFESSRFNPATGAPLSDSFFIDDRFEENNTNYTASASYDWADSWTSYFRFATAYRAGGFNENLGVPEQPVPVPATYESETFNTYEIGTKGNITDDLFVSSAAFLVRGDGTLARLNNGCQPNNPVCSERPTTFLQNFGTSEAYGVEFEFNGRHELLGGMLRYSGGVTWQEGEFTSGPLEAEELPRLPTWIYTVNVDYERDLGFGDLSGFVNVLTNGQSGGRQEIDTDFGLSAYTLTNIRLGVRSEYWTLAAYTENAFDNLYVIQRGPSSRRFNDPQIYGVRLDIRYN